MPVLPPSLRPSTVTLAALAVLATACAPSDGAPDDMDAEGEADTRGSLVELLAAGEPVFGAFSGPQTPEQGATMATESDADFILYSMESGPFDVPAMEAYLDGMVSAGGPSALDRRPVVLRVPPIEDRDETAARLDEAIPAGIAGIVFPHARTGEQARTAAELLPEAWPLDPEGSLVNILIVEDREGIENVDEIMATPGLSVVFAGPGDLRRAYDGDMEAVEGAIQTVLAACREHGVVCGVTAGVDDIEARLREGFGMIIVTEPEAVAVGKAAAGRGEG